MIPYRMLLILLLPGTVLFTGCRDEQGDQSSAADSVQLAEKQEARRKDSIRISDSMRIVHEKDAEKSSTIYKLSPEDSARVADSVARARNNVRDFR